MESGLMFAYENESFGKYWNVHTCAHIYAHAHAIHTRTYAENRQNDKMVMSEIHRSVEKINFKNKTSHIKMAWLKKKILR